MSLPTRSEMLRDDAEAAEYERAVAEGFDGTFMEWMSDHLGSAPTEPYLETPGSDDINF